ncbi:hypothetical protein H2200_008924 [Cladophialophora chaetospira]|uniref:Uncharacterized protein n=1 Tax=Cladophialophora chaetospira TaxID=386627 RepID=A0AA38X594_9EURO|nr:hypothetical protein H2200_008924 [Cladophialophora chaetospira]
MSSTGASNNEANEPRRDPEPENSFKTVYNDFQSFREAVDRAIARDPYGTLFGRRLQSPPTTNNSSWTSFSWFTDPKEIKENVPVSSAKPNSTAASSAPVDQPPVATSTNPTQQIPKETTVSYSEDEYEYDPITMRKVPVKKQTLESEPKWATTSANLHKATAQPEPQKRPPEPVSTRSEPKKQPSEGQPKKPLLQSLFFQEHGVDIPVKTFKPHKVYGYGVADKKTASKPAESDSDERKRDFDSSRKQYLRDLMSRVKGNNIDTSALFTEANIRPGPEAVPDPVIDEFAAPRKHRESPEPDDTLPLFSGTTYEARATEEVKPKSVDWLAKEGFRQSAGEGHKTSSTSSAVNIPVKKFQSKLEPALDRVQARAAQESKDKSVRLQTAVDRQQSALKRRLSSEKPVDTLASTENTDGSKQTKRAKLEAEFEARQKDAANETDFSPKSRKVEAPTTKLSKTLNNVWEHIREHPDGIVAKTMKSMTSFNENYKRYIRPDAVKGLTEKLIFKDESLSKTPSIYKTEAQPLKVKPFTPSHHIVDTEKVQQQRATSLREESEKIKKDAEAQNAQISKLATEIRAVYESEYGIIDSNHRQPTSTLQATPREAAAEQPAPESTQAVTSKSHPLLNASIKPGVETNLVVANHVNRFEPRLADLVDRAKQVHAQLREIRSQTKEIQRARSVSASDGNKKAEEPNLTVPSWSEVIQGAKDVRRVLHETRSAIRIIETGRPDIAWKVPAVSGSDFGRKRIDLSNQSIPEIETSIPVNDTKESKTPNTVSDAKEPERLQPLQSPNKQDQRIVPEPVHTPSGSLTWNDEQIPSVETLRGTNFDSPYLILTFDSSTSKVNFSPLNEPTMDMPKSTNLIHILGRLRNASEFLKHFQTMQKAGYSLYNGTEKLLIFQKERVNPFPGPKAAVEPPPVTEQVVSISAEDARPVQPLQKAATVLDELPTELDPPPGPAAPTAPPSRPSKVQPKMRRQENVFSGTIRPSVVSEEAPAVSSSKQDFQNAQTESLWKRFTRSVRRTILTVAAISVGAYSIGVVAEGLGAHSQQQKGIANGDALGPRKRIVMTNQRPGIFSTESSR